MLGIKYLLTVVLVSALLSACVGHGNTPEESENRGANTSYTKINSDIAYAVNFGGSAYLSNDGIQFSADNIEGVSAVGLISNIKGAQDPTVFKSYREGPINLTLAVDNGVYDLTMLFAEPETHAVGSRVFDVVAEGETVIDDLDVKLMRDGNHHASLDRTIIGVEVTDGNLKVALVPQKGTPVISALVVRKTQNPMHGWSMVWNDEFSNPGQLDMSKWSYNVWPAGKVNTEDQAYTNREKNVRVVDGKLILEAHKEDYSGANYTSGRVHSLAKGDFMYGRANIRAKLPGGQGSWAALWMLPSDPFKYSTTCEVGADWQGSDECDAWPNSGEIDIMEHVGYDMNTIHGTVHTKDYYWVNGRQRKASIDGQDVAEAFHEYAVEWSPERIDIYFDNTRYFTYLNDSDRWQSWPFDHPYHLVMNLAIGGDWGRAGGPIDDAIFPVRMEIDYVRIYKPTVELELSKR